MSGNVSQFRDWLHKTLAFGYQPKIEAITGRRSIESVTKLSETSTLITRAAEDGTKEKFIVIVVPAADTGDPLAVAYHTGHTDGFAQAVNEAIKKLEEPGPHIPYTQNNIQLRLPGM